MKKIYAKYIGTAALVVLLMLQAAWVNRLYRLSLSNCRQTMDQCLTQVIDEELKMRLVSLGIKFQAGFNFYTDTATFVTKTIATQDTTFSVLVNRNDPTVPFKAYQYMLNDRYPMNVETVDILFRRCMNEHFFPVKDSYIELINLRKHIVVSSDAPEEKPSGYVESSTIALDIINTIGVRAYMDVDVLVIIKPFLTYLIITIILTLIELYCIVWLVRTVYRQRKQSMFWLRNMTTDLRQSAALAEKDLDAIADRFNSETYSEEDIFAFDRAYEQFQYTNDYLQIMQYILDNEKKRIEFTKMPVNLKFFMDSLKTEFEQNTKYKTVKITVDVGDTIVFTDEMFFERIMRNLLNNAIKFSNDPVEIHIGVEKGKHSIVVYVCDDGWGIPPKEIKRIFNPTYRIEEHEERLKKKGIAPGHGLGLTFVESIMQGLDGNVFIRSKIGKYTEVQLLFLFTDTDKNLLTMYNNVVKRLFIFFGATTTNNRKRD